MTRKYLLLVLATLMFRYETAAQSLNGTVLRMQPTTLPVTCNTGDLRIDSTNNYALSVCVANIWSVVSGSSPNPTNTLGDMVYNQGGPSGGTLQRLPGNKSAFMTVLSQTGVGTASAAPAWTNVLTGLTLNGTASFASTAAFASTASFSTTASSAGTAAFSTLSSTASTSGTAAFATLSSTASTSGTASFATTSTTASTSGTAAFSALTGGFNGTLAVTSGGTGAGSLTAFTVLLGNGTSTPLQLAPGGSGTVLVGSTTPSFTGTPLGLLGLGINDTSGGAALYVKAVDTSSVGLIVKALTNQTSDSIQVLDSSGVPQMIFNAGGNFKFFHNFTPTTTRFDVRGAVSQSSPNAGNNARYSMFIGDPTALAANVGAGIALGGRNTASSGSETPYGYIWVNKDNLTAGDVSGSLHFATRNNSTGLVQRALELDSSGNTNVFYSLNMNGTASGVVSIKVQTAAGTYNFNLPTSAGTLGQVLQSGGGGTVATVWASKIATSQVFTTGSSATYTAPGTVPMTLKVTLIGSGGGAGGSASGAAQASAGAGGGGGGACIGFINTTGGTTYTYTVGGGGSGGTGGTNGTAGTSTTFNNFTASSGNAGAGQGGAVLADNIGGAGGIGSNCTTNIRGGPGSPGLVLSAAVFVSGNGGNSGLGAGGGGVAVSGNSNGSFGEKYGGGGGGSSSTGGAGANNGGSGANGLIIVEEYY